jgi:hypothetical protein
MTSSVHWAHRGISSVCTVQAARLPGGPTGVPHAHRVGLAATAKLGGRSQSVVMEPSLSWMASRQAPDGRS